MKTMILVFLTAAGATAIILAIANLLRGLAISCPQRRLEAEIRQRIAELEQLLDRHHRLQARPERTPLRVKTAEAARNA